MKHASIIFIYVRRCFELSGRNINHFRPAKHQAQLVANKHGEIQPEHQRTLSGARAEQTQPEQSLNAVRERYHRPARSGTAPRLASDPGRDRGRRVKVTYRGELDAAVIVRVDLRPSPLQLDRHRLRCRAEQIVKTQHTATRAEERAK